MLYLKNKETEKIEEVRKPGEPAPIVLAERFNLPIELFVLDLTKAEMVGYGIKENDLPDRKQEVTSDVTLDTKAAEFAKILETVGGR